MNHCVDCRWYVHHAKNLEYGMCGRTQVPTTLNDRYLKWIVTGHGPEPNDRKFAMAYCTLERQPTGQCGPDGKHFEPHLLSDGTIAVKETGLSGYGQRLQLCRPESES